MDNNPLMRPHLYCSFCLKNECQVEKMIQASQACICNICVTTCVKVLDDSNNQKKFETANATTEPLAKYYSMRHWQGRFKSRLEASYAYFILVAASVLRHQVQFYMERITVPNYFSIAYIANMAFFVLVCIWVMVGIYRYKKGKAWFYKISTYFLGCCIFYAEIIPFFRISDEEIAALFYPLETYKSQLTIDNNILKVQGFIGSGMTNAVAILLNEHKNISMIAFDSPGGYAVEGMGLGNLLRKHAITSFVGKESFCNSACTFALVGSPKRYAQKGATLAFHQALLFNYNTNETAQINAFHKEYFVSMGASSAFMDKVFTYHYPNYWIPKLAELKEAGIITDIKDNFTRK